LRFFKAEIFETGTIWAMFSDLCQTMVINYKWLAFLRCFKNAYRYVTICIPYIILAKPFFDGKVKFGQISQASLAFSNLLASLNLIITKIHTLTTLSATTDRITSLRSAIDECSFPSNDSLQRTCTEIDSIDSEEKRNLIGYESRGFDMSITVSNGPEFIVSDLTVVVPGTKKVLISDLTYDFSQGSVLIMGPSGVGKSSLFRVLSGLWQPAGGQITKPPDSKIMFIPQVPYMPLMKNNTL